MYIYIYWTKCEPAALIYIIIGSFLITNIFMYYSRCHPVALIYIIIGLFLITNIFMYYSKCHPAPCFYFIIGHKKRVHGTETIVTLTTDIYGIIGLLPHIFWTCNKHSQHWTNRYPWGNTIWHLSGVCEFKSNWSSISLHFIILYFISSCMGVNVWQTLNAN